MRPSAPIFTRRRLLGRQEDLHVDVVEVHQGQRLAARRPAPRPARPAGRAPGRSPASAASRRRCASGSSPRSARATSTSCCAVCQLASASESVARVVSSFVVRTSSSRCEPAPCFTSLLERVDLDLRELDLALLLDDRGLRSPPASRARPRRRRWPRPAATPASPCRAAPAPGPASPARPRRRGSPSPAAAPWRRRRRAWPRSGRCPTTMPSGSSFCFCLPVAEADERDATTDERAPAMIHFRARFESFFAMPDSLSASPLARARCSPARAAATAMSPQFVRAFISFCVASGTTGCVRAHLPAAAQRLVERDQVGRDRRPLTAPGRSAARSSDRCASSTRW